MDLGWIWETATNKKMEDEMARYLSWKQGASVSVVRPIILLSDVAVSLESSRLRQLLFAPKIHLLHTIQQGSCWQSRPCD